MNTTKLQILVDADACPRVLKEIIYPKKCVANVGSLCNSIKVLVSR